MASTVAESSPPERRMTAGAAESDMPRSRLASREALAGFVCGFALRIFLDQLVERLARAVGIADLELTRCDVEQCIRHLLAFRIVAHQESLAGDGVLELALRILGVAHPVLGGGRKRA